MTTNTLSVIDFVARESLRVAHEELKFLKTIDRQYDSTFAKTGAKIGDALRVRNPNEFTRRTGSRIMDVQDITETTQSVTVATQDGVDIRFNSAEMALAMDDLSRRYIEPAVKTLVSGIEADVLQDITQGVPNLVGTAGTVPGTSGDTSMIGQARARLNQFLAPGDDRHIQIDSDTMASIVNGNKAIFHDGAQVREAFREGAYTRGAGFDWWENERIYVHTNGSDHTTVTTNDTAIATGDAAITLAGGNFTKGSVFTFGTAADSGVYAVHPQTKDSYSFLKQFVATAAGTTAMALSPTIYSTGPRQNVSRLPVTSKVVTFFGSASTAYKQALAYQKEFATFVTADLPLMDDAARCVRRVQDGLSVRVWQASDIRNDEMLLRIDILYGWKLLRPEWGVRINCT
jgi:hypothetical protein